MRWEIRGESSPGALVGPDLEDLWRADPHRSPFCAPAYLDQMVELARRERAEPFIAAAISADGTAAAAWPLRRDRGGTVRMLQTFGADHCPCLARAGVSPADLSEGLVTALREADGRALFLENVPSWGPTLSAARLAITETGWKGRSFAAAPCPVLRVPEGPGAAEALRHKVSSSNPKKQEKRENRLKRLPGFAFKAIEGDADLAGWAEDFCNAHEWRWNLTQTPSEFQSEDARRRWLALLGAWARAGVAVRFSLEAEGRRIAFVAGLKAGDRLIYYRIAYSPSHADFSPTLVLLRRLVGWMGERGFTCLDFGVGGESYKLRYADADEPLWRLTAARHALSPVYVRGVIEDEIRKSERTRGLWDEWVNGKLRGDVQSTFDRARLRMRRAILSDARQPLSVLRGRLRTRLVSEEMTFYEAPATEGRPDAEVVLLTAHQVLALLGDELSLDPAARARVLEIMAQGDRPFGVVQEGRAVQVCWLRKAAAEEIPPGHDGGDPHTPGPAGRPDAATWAIVECVTARRARGQGLYPKVLRAVRAAIPPAEACLIWTHDWNVASRRGISKAGFQPIAIRVRRTRDGTVETRWLPVR
jgi:CelD/BcsL family acetyltransferase involved in cellulose biosynthesis